MIDGDQPYLVPGPLDREGGPDVSAIEYRNRSLIANERDDRVIAAVERNIAKLHDQLVFVSPFQRRHAIAVGSHREALEVISGAMDPDQGVNGLRGTIGVDAEADVNVFTPLKHVTRRAAPIADHDVSESRRGQRSLRFRLAWRGARDRAAKGTSRIRERHRAPDRSA
jgi:hypothetical protein